MRLLRMMQSAAIACLVIKSLFPHWNVTRKSCVTLKHGAVQHAQDMHLARRVMATSYVACMHENRHDGASIYALMNAPFGYACYKSRFHAAFDLQNACNMQKSHGIRISRFVACVFESLYR